MTGTTGAVTGGAVGTGFGTGTAGGLGSSSLTVFPVFAGRKLKSDGAGLTDCTGSADFTDCTGG
ncbi:MAG TPA: hypothetical protein VKE74_17885, partial [Gemmataceae bacterium]|nr:hypothetical protein [Gemmataceae bacterium]